MTIKLPKLKVGTRTIAYFLVYLLFLKPCICDDIKALDLIFNAGRFGLALCFVFAAMATNRMNNIMLPFAIFTTIIIPTIFNNGFISKVFVLWIPAIGMLAFIELNREYLVEMIAIFYDVGRVLLFLNFLSMLLFPNGIVQRENGYLSAWILGQKQEFVYCVLSTVLFGLIMNEYSNTNKHKLFRTSIYILGMLIMGKPLGLAIALAIIVLFLIFESKIRKIGLKTMFIFPLLGEVVCIIMAYTYAKWSKLFAILSLMGTGGQGIISKADTMTVRLELWKGACEIFKRHKGLGIGIPTEAVWYIESGSYVYHSIMHNTILDIAYSGGIIAVLLYFFWNIRIIKKLDQYREKRITFCIFTVYFAFCVICLTECLYHPMTFIILGIAMNIEALTNQVYRRNYQ